jgi:DNA-binding transcriptional ArsR family regulator
MSTSPRVLDLAGRTRSVGVEIMASTLTEFLMGLQTFQFEEAASTFDVGPEWFDHVRTRAPKELIDALDRVNPVGWGSLLGMVLAEGTPPSPTQFIDRIEGMDAIDVWLLLAGAHVRPFAERFAPEVFARAAHGDVDAREQLSRVAVDLYGEDEAKGSTMRLDAAEVQRLVVTVLRGWYECVLAPEEATVADVLGRDADAKRRLRRTSSDEKLIELATNGVVWVPEPWVRRVILSPHLAMRPWNVTCAHDEVYVLCYPAADESLGIDRTAPPVSLIRLHKALSDERRLRILRLLADRDMNLQELSDALGLAKSTTHHHTVVLRAAGLIRTSTSPENRYSLRGDTVAEAGPALSQFLEGSR